MFKSPESHVASATEEATDFTSVMAVVDCQQPPFDFGFRLPTDRATSALPGEYRPVDGQRDAVLLPETLVTSAVPIGVLVRLPLVGVGLAPTSHVLAALALIRRVVRGLLGPFAGLAPVRESPTPHVGVPIELGLGPLLLALGARKNVHAGEV